MRNEVFLSAVLEGFLVVDTDTNTSVSHSIGEDGINIHWGTIEGLEYELNFTDQPVRPEGDYFYVTDTNGDEHEFRAYALVDWDEKLNS